MSASQVQNGQKDMGSSGVSCTDARSLIFVAGYVMLNAEVKKMVKESRLGVMRQERKVYAACTIT